MKLYSHTEKCWIILDERNDYIHSVARTRSAAIRDFIDWEADEMKIKNAWRGCRKDGYKAVKAEATYEYEI